MTTLEIGLVAGIVALVVILVLGIMWRSGGGDEELRELDAEVQDLARDATRDAHVAAKQGRAASILARQVRYRRRQLAFEERRNRHQRELERLDRGEAGGGGAGTDVLETPPEPPAH